MPKVTDDLQGLGVLVTRPAHQADNLCGLIEAAGGQPYRLPTIQIEASSETEHTLAQTLLKNLQPDDLLIFISANAVQYSQTLLGPANNWPANIQTAVIGQATARAFEAAFSQSADLAPSGGNNSEALLALPELQQVSGRRIIIIRGEGGRPLLGDSLQHRGADVHYASIYRRCLPEKNLAEHIDAIRNSVDVITATSVESLQNLVTMLAEPMGEWLWSRPVFVLHQRQVKAAQAMGFKIIPTVADETNDVALLSAIIKWQQENTKQ